MPLLAPIARADLDTALGPNRLAGVSLINPLARLLNCPVTGGLYAPDVLLVNRSVAHRLDRHLILLPGRCADGIAAFTHVLLVDWAVGAVALRNLIFLPHGLAHGVAALPVVLLIDRP